MNVDYFELLTFKNFKTMAATAKKPEKGGAKAPAKDSKKPVAKKK